MSAPKSATEIKEAEAVLIDAMRVHRDYRQPGGGLPLPHLTGQIATDAVSLLLALGNDEQIAKVRERLLAMLSPTT